MKSLLSNKIEGFIVRKTAEELKVGDIMFVGNLVDIVEKVEEAKEGIIITAGRTSLSSNRKAFFNCVQKEDPAIQMAIEEKLEVLRKNKITAKKKKIEHKMYDRAGYYDSDPHSWAILETSGEYEYWKDVNHGLRVLWKNNDIIGVDEGVGGGSSPMMTTKDNVIVIDKHYFNLSKYIWK